MTNFLDKLFNGSESFTWLQGTVLATLLGGSFFWFVSNSKKQKKIMPPLGLSEDEQGVLVPGKPGVYKSGLLKNSKEETVERLHPEIKTLYDSFLRGIKESGNGDCLGTRKDKDSPYKFLKYTEVWKNASGLGSAFIAKLGLKPGNDTNVGIYGKNCPEYAMSFVACVRFSMVTVPLYDTLGAEAVAYAVNQTEIEVIIVEDEAKIQKLLEIASTMPTLRHIVAMKPNAITPELLSLANAVGVELHNFYDLINYGNKNTQKDVPPKPDDTYIICYTSGTTGTPKGVILTHKNLIADIQAFARLCEDFIPEINESKNVIVISYLPLSHMFEQGNHWSTFGCGGKIGYFRGNILELTSDMQALKPTIFPVVPRLLNRFYDSVYAKIEKSNYLTKTLFKKAYASKLAEIKNRIIRKDSFWDKLVFNKIQAQLGGQVQLLITGSAPISSLVLEFCRITLGAHLIEGYGQTECTALATATWFGDHEGGHCGGPAVCSLLKLEDVPEMNYFASDGKGEILVQGPHVTKGYYKDPEKTRELLDAEGWLHTGDVGQILPNGTIKIIDRKKHIFKLAQGEYVAPEKIENIYSRSPFVQQVYVDGDSLETFLIAVVVPEQAHLKIWYTEKYGKDENVETICEMDEAKETILKDLQKFGKENQLNGIEQVKAIYLEPTPFSIENNMLTPTLKSKRPQIRQKYLPIMKEIYDSVK